MADKKVEIVAQYVSDMHVLESHILQALKRQVSQAEDQPDMHRALQSYVTTTEQHIARLTSRLEAMGNPGSGIGDKAKQGVANLFGIGAAAVDSIRTHPVSKDLRDDYTAGSLAVISYVMLRTTALACNDAQTATLAETQMGETVSMLQWIARSIPEVVVRELEKERDVQLISGAAKTVINDPKLKVLYGSDPADTAATVTR